MMGFGPSEKKGGARIPTSHGESHEDHTKCPDQISNFDIEGTRCYIVPTAKAKGDNAHDSPKDFRFPEGHVAGRFTVKGKAYVVLCVRPGSKEAEKLRETSPNISDILTKRELQIALLVAQGRINKQIAHQLDISEYTVSTHIRRIFSKLGVSSRAAMVAHVVSQLAPDS